MQIKIGKESMRLRALQSWKYTASGRRVMSYSGGLVQTAVLGSEQIECFEAMVIDQVKDVLAIHISRTDGFLFS